MTGEGQTPKSQISSPMGGPTLLFVILYFVSFLLIRVVQVTKMAWSTELAKQSWKTVTLQSTTDTDTAARS
jgi:hypothetical protein